jgi:hypothetical protein
VPFALLGDDLAIVWKLTFDEPHEQLDTRAFEAGQVPAD